MIVALVATITASFLTTAAVGGSSHSTPVKAAHFCPPMC
jgi:hypothetical protein